jgi:hypothetical protein
MDATRPESALRTAVGPVAPLVAERGTWLPVAARHQLLGDLQAEENWGRCRSGGNVSNVELG